MKLFKVPSEVVIRIRKRRPLAWALCLLGVTAWLGGCQNADRALNMPSKDAHASVMARAPVGESDLDCKTSSPDGRLFAAFYQDGWHEMVTIREAKTGKEIRRIYTGGATPTLFRFADGNRMLISYCQRHGVEVWEVATGKKLADITRRDMHNARVH